MRVTMPIAFFTTGLCGKCVPHCPGSTLTPVGHDKERCKLYTRQAVGPYVNIYPWAGRLFLWAVPDRRALRIEDTQRV